MTNDMMPRLNDQGRAFKNCCDGCITKGKACDQCLFARWNIEGLKALGNPNASLKDTFHSPLVQRLAQSPKLNNPLANTPAVRGLHAKFGNMIVPSFNRVMKLREMM